MSDPLRLTTDTKPCACPDPVEPDLIGPGDPLDARTPDPVPLEPPAPLVRRCPNCGAALPTEPVVTTLVICPGCLRSVALDDDGPRLARATDTASLSEASLKALRAKRKSARAQQV